MQWLRLRVVGGGEFTDTVIVRVSVSREALRLRSIAVELYRVASELSGAGRWQEVEVLRDSGEARARCPGEAQGEHPGGCGGSVPLRSIRGRLAMFAYLSCVKRVVAFGHTSLTDLPDDVRTCIVNECREHAVSGRRVSRVIGECGGRR